MAAPMGLAASADFCRRMGIAFRAGIDIQTLCRTEAERGTPTHRAIMGEVTKQIGAGESLYDAMLHAGPRYFPSLLLSMVRMGELSGRLERALLMLADLYQHRLSTRRSMLQRLAWPMFQLAAAIFIIGVLIWLMGVLQPATGGQMTDLLGFGLRGTSGLAIYLLIVSMIAGSLALFVQGLRKNWLNLHAAIPVFYLLPKFGPAIQTITLSRFCWTLAMALDSGLDPLRSVDLALDSTGSDYYRSESETAQKVMQEGGELAEALRKTGLFPDDFLSAMEVAELSGSDAESLMHLARDYDERAKLAIATISSVTSGTIYAMVILLIVFFIYRIAKPILGIYDELL